MLRAEPFRKAGATAPASVTTVAAAAASLGRRLALPSRSRRPTSRCATSTGRSVRSRGGRAGPRSSSSGRRGRRHRSRRSRRWRASARRSRPRASASSPSRSTRARTRPRCARPPAAPACRWRSPTKTSRVPGHVLNRHLFDRRGDLSLPTLFLVSERGEIVKLYRDPGAFPSSAEDCGGSMPTPAERLARALPFPGDAYSSPGCAQLLPVRPGAVGAGSRRRRRSAPSSGRRRLDPSAAALFNLGTLYMKAGRTPQAETAFERALELQPAHYESGNSLGALLAQNGELPRAVERFRAALSATAPTSRTRSTTSATRSSSPARPPGVRALQEGARAAARLRGGAQQPRHLLRPGRRPRARRGSLPRRRSSRPGYGEAANNLALVLTARGDAAGAITVLQRLLEERAGLRSSLRDARADLPAGRAQARSDPGARAAAAAQPEESRRARVAAPGSSRSLIRVGPRVARRLSVARVRRGEGETGSVGRSGGCRSGGRP